jgi:hypothetical protein
VLRHPVVAILPLVVLVVVLVGGAVTTAPTYTAESRIVVGRLDVEAQSVPGFTAANNSLAATYARLVGSTQHVEEIADQTERTADEVRGRVGASPIPESPIIRVEASGSSEADTIELADQAAAALITLVDRLNDPSERGLALLDDYREAASALAAATLERDLLAEQVETLQAEGASAARVQAVQEQLTEADATVAEAQLRTETLANLYQESQQARSDSDLLRQLSTGQGTGSDARQTILAAGITAVLVGTLLGIALAWLVANWRALRAATRSAGRSWHRSSSGDDAVPQPADELAPDDQVAESAVR